MMFGLRPFRRFASTHVVGNPSTFRTFHTKAYGALYSHENPLGIPKTKSDSSTNSTCKSVNTGKVGLRQKLKGQLHVLMRE